MAEIQYLFFDLGNVILPFDHTRAATRIADAIDSSPSLVIEWIFDSGLQQAFECGEINQQVFCDRFSKMSNS